jgi:hypothetical protein
MNLFDRLRDRLASPGDDTWDDHDVQDVAALVAMLVTAWDARPDDRRLTASRAAMLGTFAASTAAATTSSQGALGRTSPAGRAPGIRRGGRRPALALAAAAALLVTSIGAAAASAPGGPLYDLRLAGEVLLLPGTPDDRYLAQVARLDARLGDASGAADQRDTAGVIAALRAYARIGEDAAAGPPVDARTAAQLVLRIRAQRGTIERIGGDDPAVVAAREQAQIAARAMLGSLGEPDGGPGPGPSSGSDPQSSQAPSPSSSPAPATPRRSADPDGSGGPGGTGGQNATSGPAGTMEPGGTSTPGGPNATNGPRATSGPTGTAGPGGQGAPTPSATPRPTPQATPRASVNPTPSPGGGSGPGSPGGGDAATPRPGSGSGEGGSAPETTATAGGHP